MKKNIKKSKENGITTVKQDEIQSANVRSSRRKKRGGCTGGGGGGGGPVSVAGIRG